jgi:heat shock protein HtpX
MFRVIIFAAANLGILLVMGVVFQLIGLDIWLVQSGTGFNTAGVLAFAACFGFGGAFISLALSKFMAKRGMGVQMITTPGNAQERWLVDTVHRQAKKVGIEAPEVGIFQQPQPNAFATGMTRNRSLVAVSTGLLNTMSQAEVEAVLGHEVAHVANGDMITMALLQGLLNTFVIFLSRLAGFFVDKVILKNQRGLGMGYFITSIIAQIFLSCIATVIALWFSRRREFRADEGGARLAGKQNMINALKKLQQVQAPQDLPGEFAAFGISGSRSGISQLFLSHPPLEQRIETLQRAQIL